MDQAKLPSDQRQLITATQRQFRFYRQTLRFYGLLGFVLLVSVAFLVVTIVKDSNSGTAPDYLASLLGTIQVFGIIICAFIGGDAIAMDFGGGTGYYVLVLPVRRSVLLLGRYIAAFAVSFLLILVVYLMAILGTVYFYGVGGVPWDLVVQSLALSALYAAAIVATAFFLSSLFRSPAMSMITTVLILFLGLDIADEIVQVSGYEPWYSIYYAGQVISTVISPVPHKMTVGMGRFEFVTYSPYIWEGALIMLGYLVVFLPLSLFLYNRKESKG